jgi:dTDP-glucose pyrophosphorylase/predicted transcriptional regulator
MWDVRDIFVAPDWTILQALERIESGSAQIVLVIDAADRLLGTVTDGDIRRAILRGIPLEKPVSIVMNKNPLTFTQAGGNDAAFALMRERSVHQLPVVDSEQRVVGLITLDAVLHGLREHGLVVLMAGGLGTRLRPLTEMTPKPLLPIGGRPLLEITIDNLARQGFGRFVLSVNYRAEMFREHFGNGQRLGVQIDYVVESERLGTAGALRLLPDRPDTPVLVMNGDILTTLDARRLMLFHRNQGVSATMCVREHEWQVPYGVVQTGEAGRLAGFEEKPLRRELVNAGIYVLSPETIDLLPVDGTVDMPTLFDNIAKRISAPAVYQLREYWLDIGHLHDLQRAHDDVPTLFQ